MEVVQVLVILLVVNWLRTKREIGNGHLGFRYQMAENINALRIVIPVSMFRNFAVYDICVQNPKCENHKITHEYLINEILFGFIMRSEVNNSLYLLTDMP